MLLNVGAILFFGLFLFLIGVYLIKKIKRNLQSIKVIKTVTLYRPVNPAELDLIKQSFYIEFPPRLKGEPFFYSVMNEEYATQITKKRNVSSYGAGYVLKFNIDADYISKFDVKTVGGEIHKELWVPSEELEEFNSNIVGHIQVTQKYE